MLSTGGKRKQRGMRSAQTRPWLLHDSQLAPTPPRPLLQPRSPPIHSPIHLENAQRTERKRRRSVRACIRGLEMTVRGVAVGRSCREDPCDRISFNESSSFGSWPALSRALTSRHPTHRSPIDHHLLRMAHISVGRRSDHRESPCSSCCPKRWWCMR